MTESAPTRFLLIRHAESEWNAAGRWQGQADPPLSARGLAQAEALARELAGERADALWSSDLRRARETAAPIAEALGLQPGFEPRLRELDIGSWTGCTRSEILTRDPEALLRFEAGDPEQRAGGAESRAAIRIRVRGLFAELCEQNPGRYLIVVTHRGVLRALQPAAETPNAATLRLDASDLILST